MSFSGSLSSLSATKLGSVAIKNAVDRSGLEKRQVEEVFMGCVVQAGVGQAPARQAALFAGFLFRFIWKQYLSQNRQSFENLSKWKEAFIENAVPTNSDSYPFICMGNKLDK